MSEDRLQKILAQAGYGSRRDCEKYLTEGRVKVNGQVAELGQKANPFSDHITVDGSRVTVNAPVYVALNKPKGVLSSTEDELAQGRQTVRDLVELPGHLYPVGRLDRQSRGLMLLTNDGDLAHRLTHPRYGHEKEYRVVVEGIPSEETLEQWRKGVLLDERKTRRAKVEIIRIEKDKTFLRIIMREGRKRQIRRVATILGHPVKQLTRERIATLQLNNLRPGEWRHLSEGEVAALKRSVGTAQPAPRKRPAARGKPGGADRRRTGGADRSDDRRGPAGRSPGRKSPGRPGGSRNKKKD